MLPQISISSPVDYCTVDRQTIRTFIGSRAAGIFGQVLVLDVCTVSQNKLRKMAWKPSRKQAPVMSWMGNLLLSGKTVLKAINMSNRLQTFLQQWWRLDSKTDEKLE